MWHRIFWVDVTGLSGHMALYRFLNYPKFLWFNFFWCQNQYLQIHWIWFYIPNDKLYFFAKLFLRDEGVLYKFLSTLQSPVIICILQTEILKELLENGRLMLSLHTLTAVKFTCCHGLILKANDWSRETHTSNDVKTWGMLNYISWTVEHKLDMELLLSVSANIKTCLKEKFILKTLRRN